MVLQFLRLQNTLTFSISFCSVNYLSIARPACLMPCTALINPSSAYSCWFCSWTLSWFSCLLFNPVVSYFYVNLVLNYGNAYLFVACPRVKLLHCFLLEETVVPVPKFISFSKVVSVNLFPLCNILRRQLRISSRVLCNDVRQLVELRVLCWVHAVRDL